MAMPAAHSNWTVDMLDALPDDGQRYEIIDGTLFVTPSPSDIHQYVVGELHAQLLQYLRGSGVGHPVIAPTDVRRGDRRRNRVQPDVFVVRVVDGKRPAYPFAMETLLLVAEVQSPSNATYDYHEKRELYLANGVPEYWVVNPDARNVSRWRKAEDPGAVLSQRLEWHPAGMRTALSIDIQSFFAEALGS